MSTATEISRLQASRNTIRDKLVNLGLASSTDKLDALATAVNGIVNNGSVSAEVHEGSTYTIPAGYHNGAGTVSGVSGEGNYMLQSKSVTPTKNQQVVTPDTGKYGLSDVTVAAIPNTYQDVSGVTATASDVLTTKIIVNSSGTSIAGTMPNNSAVSATLSASSSSYSIPAGYHNGSGVVQIVPETKSVTPSTSSQAITPSTGKVLTAVNVAAIPNKYGDATGKTATAAQILDGRTAIGWNSTDSQAVSIEGTMTNNGSVSKVLDAATNNQTYTVPQGYHNGSGTVSIVLETKTVTPSTSSQNITPTSGKVLSKVTVNSIPSSYGNVSDATGSASDVLSGKIVYGKDSNGNAVKLTGSITNNGSVGTTLNGTTNTSYTIPAGYTSGGTVTIDNTIETALAAI